MSGFELPKYKKDWQTGASQKTIKGIREKDARGAAETAGCV